MRRCGWCVIRSKSQVGGSFAGVASLGGEEKADDNQIVFRIQDDD